MYQTVRWILFTASFKPLLGSFSPLEKKKLCGQGTLALSAEIHGEKHAQGENR